jgi:CRP/FNR family transcriptional regulator
MASRKNSLNIKCFICQSRKDSLFSDLCSDDLDLLEEGKSCVTYKRGQTLFYEGTRPMGLFCINSGKVKVYKVGAQGREQIVRLSKPGDFLGYRALLSDEFYGASATVIEDAAICFIPKANFLNLLRVNPAFFAKMTSSICKELGVMEEKLATIAQKSVRERLATTLLMLKESYGIEGEESALIDINLSREDLANIVGTATETVIRLLSEFKGSNLISFEGKKIRVLNPKALVKEADFYT